MLKSVLCSAAATKQPTPEEPVPKPKVKRGRPERSGAPYEIDWDAAKLEFVTSHCTLETISEKFNIPRTSVARHSRQENWKGLREEYRAKFQDSVIAAKVDNAVDRIKVWNEETLIHAGLLREAAQRMIQYPVKEAGGKVVWRYHDKLPANSLTAAAAAYVASDKLARLALGASTDNVNQTNKNLPATVDDFF
jgi:hypothetical protein